MCTELNYISDLAAYAERALFDARSGYIFHGKWSQLHFRKLINVPAGFDSAVISCKCQLIIYQIYDKFAGLLDDVI